MGLALYNIFLFLYTAGIHLVALWNKKAAQWVAGRRNNPVDQLPASTQTQTVWMHCASLGEFEQGRPLLESVKAAYPQSRIILTFFSPSGYEIRKNYNAADKVLYLPMDGPGQSRAFIEAINPTLVLWVKYEYWYYYLHTLAKKNIPVLLVSGIFRQSQPFFKWYGGFWKTILRSFDHLFVQTQSSQQLLAGIGVREHITVTGDTRFDRVISIAEQWESPGEMIQQFCEGHPVIVAGSTWEEDEEELIHYARTYPHIRFIFAPHEISKERIADLQQEFPQGILYSSLANRQAGTVINSNVLIIDNIGLLSRLYKCATIAYIGGGFNQSGIHNVLEAAVYGKPIVFGPVYEKFAEATALVDLGAAFSFETALELEDLLNKLLKDEALLKHTGAIAKDYVYSQKGATATILDYIHRNRLLTN
ncbi:MAG: 3-deoxy-D-manno-octulosonic acid transferase [Chitinophagaceae bacterium]|nr:MAG: 3-deoxy-D-manno-octulosonic acid transferase [Chitinophagaceae bacterium]